MILLLIRDLTRSQFDIVWSQLSITRMARFGRKGNYGTTPQ